MTLTKPVDDYYMYIKILDIMSWMVKDFLSQFSNKLCVQNIKMANAQ